MGRTVLRQVYGVTMVELLVAVIIVGVILTLAVPAFNDLIARERLRGVNDQLVVDFKYARSEAIQRNEPVRVDFRSDGALSCYSVYAVTVGGNCDCLLGAEQCLAGEYGASLVLLKLVQMPSSAGVSMSTDVGSTTIYPTRALHTRSMAITLRSVRGPQLITTVTDRGTIATCSPDQSVPGLPACAL